MNPEFQHSAHGRVEHPRIEHSTEVTDSKKHEFGFGEGGVPWFLLFGYLAFLVFFSWYVVAYPLKDFEEHSPFPISAEAGPGAMQTGAMQTGSMPTGSMPTGSMPTGAMPTGSMPTGAMQTGSMQTGSMQTGSMQTGSMRTVAMRTVAMRTAAMRTAAMRTGFAPDGQ